MVAAACTGIALMFGPTAQAASTTPVSAKFVQVEASLFSSTDSTSTGSIALDANGEIWSWGWQADGQDVLIPTKLNTGVIRFDAVAVGQNFWLALDTNGNIWSWGRADNGRLGNGSTSGSILTPTQVTTGTSFKAISAGSNFSIALDGSGDIWAWGNSANGRLGNNSTSGNISTPFKLITVPAGTSFQSIVAGDGTTLALDTVGNIWAWGNNTDGRVGDGTQTDVLAPKKISPTGLFYKTVSVGRYSSFAIGTDGSIWSWGNPAGGQLGNDTTTGSFFTPAKLTATGIQGKSFSAISGGGGSPSHTLALDEQGNLWSWGGGGNGRLGNGTSANVLEPTQVVTVSVKFDKISAGRTMSAGIDEVGNIRTWGAPSEGQLGNGTTSGNVLTPVAITWLLPNIQVGEFVYYSQFGADVLGNTCSADAIRNAHNFANLNDIKVKADDGAIYYIGDMNSTITIQTDTDWGNAQFIIDDSAVDANSGVAVFTVRSKLPTTSGLDGVTSLTKGQTKLNRTFTYPSLVRVEDNSVEQYIRTGGNANDGTSMQDSFIVDQDGNVSPSSPILWDFTQISSATIYPIDSTPLTIKGGEFTTINDQIPYRRTYYERNIRIERSNTVIDGIHHDVYGENVTLGVGRAYHGFIFTANCTNILAKNVVMTGRRAFYPPAEGGARHSSYDFQALHTIDLTVIDSSQTNSIHDTDLWGVFTSNFCKNMVFDNVNWSRIDAHQGVHNVTIRNSTLGHQNMSLIGSGTLLVENVSVQSHRFIFLRNDYGSTWNGDIIIRNCIFISTVSNPIIIDGWNVGDHYYGYQCYMPTTVTINGLHVIGLIGSNQSDLSIFGTNTSQYYWAEVGDYSSILTEAIYIFGLTRSSGNGYTVSRGNSSWLSSSIPVYSICGECEEVICICCEHCGKYPCVCCPICGDIDCEKSHQVCPICGEYDCELPHPVCPVCGEYDCEKPHPVCPVCGDYDCELPHPVCPVCGDYDCEKPHPICLVCGNHDCEKPVCLVCGDHDCELFCPICGDHDCELPHPVCQVCGDRDCELPHPKCPICNEYDCEKPVCPVCGNHDCEKPVCQVCGDHDCEILCPICGDHDCELPHPVCPVCGDHDCELPHPECPVCGENDCDKKHGLSTEEIIILSCAGGAGVIIATASVFLSLRPRRKKRVVKLSEYNAK